MRNGLLHAVKGASVAAALLIAPAVLAAPMIHHRSESPQRREWVPEFDPAAGGALVALLAGGALYIAARRKSK